MTLEEAIMPAQTAPNDRLVGGYNVTCTKCGKSFSSQADYLTHTQVGYACGPVAR